MEEYAAPPLTAIEQIANGNQLQMLKAIIPYVEFKNQKFLALYIKVMELGNILTFYEDSDSPMKACSMENTSFSPKDMLNDMRKYCSSSQREMLDTCLNLLNTMELFETYKEMFSQSDNGGDGEGQSQNPMDFVMNMLSPEQQSMFETYNTMFDSEGK